MGLWLWARGKKPLWSFVIDTNSYAGNFERELAAYVVGRCDDFGMGIPRVVPYLNQHYLECPDSFRTLSEDRISDPGDDGICRAPMDFAPTPGKKGAFNSVALFLTHKPSKLQLAMLVERARRFPSLSWLGSPGKDPDMEKFFSFSKIRILGCRLVEERTVLVSHKVVG